MTPTNMLRRSAGAAVFVAVGCSGHTLAAQSSEAFSIKRSGPSIFVFDASSVTYSAEPALFLRLGEKISRHALKRRFAGYDVHYTKGEGCLTCAVISGSDGHDRCSITIKDQQPTDIPACARIGGFQVIASKLNSKTQDGYILICRGQLSQSSSGNETTTRLRTPITVKVYFTGGETIWIDPRDKAETIFENLTLSLGDRPLKGGQVKGSTFASSTSYDDSFRSTGKGSANWGYTKRLDAFTLTVQKQTYVCTDTASKSR